MIQHLSPRQTAPSLSLVIPVKNEEGNIPVLLERLFSIFTPLTEQWEMIFVVDGSEDNTLAKLLAAREVEPRIKIIRLSRNFGQEAALITGLRYADGDVTIPLDADLQDPPELIPQLIDQWKLGYDIVLAHRESRQGDATDKRLFADWFYRLYNLSAERPIPTQTCYFRLMDRKVVDAINGLRHKPLFLRGILSWVGFTTTQISFDRPARHYGHSAFGYLKLLALALNGFFYFAPRPFRLWSVWCFLLGAGFCLRFLWQFVMANSHSGDGSSGEWLLLGVGSLLIQTAIISETSLRNLQLSRELPISCVAESWGIGSDDA